MFSGSASALICPSSALYISSLCSALKRFKYLPTAFADAFIAAFSRRKPSIRESISLACSCTLKRSAKSGATRLNALTPLSPISSILSSSLFSLFVTKLSYFAKNPSAFCFSSSMLGSFSHSFLKFPFLSTFAASNLFSLASASTFGLRNFIGLLRFLLE